MFKALIIEIKNTIFKTWYHFIRFLGLMLIPLIYGFSYIFAFYDPFTKVNQVDVAVAVQRTSTHENALGDAIARQLEKGQKVHMGDVSMTMKTHTIYYEDWDNVNEESIVRDNYAVLRLPDMSTMETNIIDVFKSYQSMPAPKKIDIKKLMLDLPGLIINSPNTLDKDKIKFVVNDKKNYLLAFGMKVASGMTATYQKVIQVAVEAMGDQAYIDQLIKSDPTVDKGEWTSFITHLNQIGFHKLVGEKSLITIESHMGGEEAKYGYGLAPFFISVAMWIGGMVMTFAVHRRIYDTSITPGYRYFAKWLLIVFGIIVQATVLSVALYLIGFNKLGIHHWGMMYLTTIITGVVFASIIQAIRFTIHERNISIILVVILLVLQMASAGGLFPVKVQSGFYGVVNKIVPMGRTTIMLREAAFDTNWSNYFINMSYLLIWLTIIPVGVWINLRRTTNLYLANNIPMPRKMQEVLVQRQMYKKRKKYFAPHNKGGDK